VAELPAKLGGFAFEIIEGGVVLAAQAGVQVLDEAKQAVVAGFGGVKVDGRHDAIPFL
jgi:hypothetical protein